VVGRTAVAGPSISNVGNTEKQDAYLREAFLAPSYVVIQEVVTWKSLSAQICSRGGFAGCNKLNEELISVLP